MKLRHRVKRWLGVVSPSGAYPLPPRWAMSKLGRSRWYPSVVANGDRSVAAGGSIGNVWAGDIAAGPLTRFGTNGREHACAAVCDPASPAHRPCFDQVPYVPLKDREPLTRHRDGDAPC
jgi:hypothetical protein